MLGQSKGDVGPATVDFPLVFLHTAHQKVLYCFSGAYGDSSLVAMRRLASAKSMLTSGEFNSRAGTSFFPFSPWVITCFFSKGIVPKIFPSSKLDAEEAALTVLRSR